MTLEQLQAPIQKLFDELTQEICQEIRQDIRKFRQELIRWMVGIFFGSVVLVLAAIAMYICAVMHLTGGAANVPNLF